MPFSQRMQKLNGINLQVTSNPLVVTTAVATGLALSVFCVMLDNTIIATATPKITDDFKATGDVGWYGSSYLLTTCAFQLFWGKLYSFSSIKVIYMITFTIFQLGSLVCGAAPTSAVLIAGRAIAGFGAAGILNGAILIIASVVPLKKRPLFLTLFSGIQSIGSVVGPLMGGAFTDHLSWRWCFYINLPIGLVTLILIALFFEDRNTLATRIPGGWKAKFQEFDLYGTLVLLPMVTCLLLALQWGGSKYEWKDVKVIVLLVIGAVLSLVFARIQFYLSDKATLPPRILRYSTVQCAAWYGTALTAALFAAVYYIPIWFQTIKDTTATGSAIKNLPLVLGTIVAALASGMLATATSFYSPMALLATSIMSIGAGLLTTFKPNSGSPHWIGFQALFGLGIGTGTQLPILAIQANVDSADIPIATAVCTFTQTLGGSIAISVAQNIFAQKLATGLRAIDSNLDAKAILSTGVSQLVQTTSEESLPAMRRAINDAVVATFYVTVACSVATIFAAHFSEGRRIMHSIYARVRPQRRVSAVSIELQKYD